MESLLARAKNISVSSTPFPHVVIERPIADDLCQALLAAYPPEEALIGPNEPGSNLRFTWPARKALKDPVTAALWRDFVRLHSSPAFLAELLELFRPHVSALYPGLAAALARRPWRSGVRFHDSFPDVDFLLDAQICLNSPVRERPSSVRGPHVDMPNKLFAGLFYLRSEDDTSQGGDLELYRFKGEPGGFQGVYAGERHIEREKTIRYEDNVLVLMLNCVRAVHGVSPRSPTDFPRRLFNLVVEVDAPLFDLAAYQAAP